jgi:hypothetical protein
MPETVVINPFAVHTSDQLSRMPDVSEETLAKARHLGTLRAVKEGRRTLYLGEDVLSWLRSEPHREAKGGGGVSNQIPRILPEMVFTQERLNKALNLKPGTLPRECRLKRLRYAKREGRIYFLG